MKKLLVLIFALFSIAAFAQDRISLHNGKVIDGSVISVGEFTVTYVYKNERSYNKISRYAVDRITYGSGREESITQRITVNSRLDWENVVIIEDKTQITGLTKCCDVSSRSRLVGNYKQSKAIERAIQSIKKDAAENGCPFVWVESTSNALDGTYYTTKQGKAYKY